MSENDVLLPWGFRPGGEVSFHTVTNILSPATKHSLFRFGTTERGWEYTPQPDITPYELAHIIPMLIAASQFNYQPDRVPEYWNIVQRHFTPI